MNNFIVIHHKGEDLWLSKAFAKKKNLRHGQKIESESVFNKIFLEHVSHNLDICNHAINAKNNKN